MAHIAFFGTPEFAADILRALHEYCLNSHHSLKFVGCQPDRAANRGMQVIFSPVKEYALKNNLTLYQPNTLKKASPEGDEFFSIMQEERPDICIVAAYGKIIPPRFLALPKFGFINVHASLLPRWRGASPIHHAIMHGDKETGVAIMQLVSELDAGPVFSLASLSIGSEDTTGSVTKTLADLGAQLLIETLPKILDRSVVAKEQGAVGITFAPTLSKDAGLLDWNKQSEVVIKQIYAMQPWPRAYTFYHGKRLFFFSAHKSDWEKNNAVPGEILHLGDEMVVATADGAIAFGEIQAEGKKRMSMDQFVKGCTIVIGSSFDGKA